MVESIRKQLEEDYTQKNLKHKQALHTPKFKTQHQKNFEIFFLAIGFYLSPFL